MKLLLDTHIWVWSLDNPERLSDRVTDALGNPENEVWLSPISVWEVLLLVEKGRLKLDRDPFEWVAQGLQASRAREATLNHHVAIRSRAVQLDHEDPADRFLAATAELYELTLVTEDERLLVARSWNVIPNRKGSSG